MLVHSTGDSIGVQRCDVPHRALVDEPFQVWHQAGVEQRVDHLPVSCIPANEQDAGEAVERKSSSIETTAFSRFDSFKSLSSWCVGAI